MIRYKEFQLLFLLILIAFSAIAENLPTYINSNDSAKISITQDETILFNMINDMRRQDKLPSIPLSLDLCKVAQIHIADLIKWKPQDKGCSLHSWSGSGKWTSCCNTNEVFGIQCMKAKPREITGYPGDGYELIYWGEDNAIPSEAADLWKKVEASSDMILNQSKWSGYQWKAMGVGIKSGYAILWLGDADNTTSNVSVGEKQPVEQNAVPKPVDFTKTDVPGAKNKNPESPVSKTAFVSHKEIKGVSVGVIGVQNYLIVGSYKGFESANSELKKIKAKGYPAAFIYYHEPFYRITIAYFEESSKAQIMKNELKETFTGIWILRE